MIRTSNKFLVAVVSFKVKMKEDKEKSTESVAPVKFERRSTERRAAKIANTKIAESTKILASNKIIATAGLDTPAPKPRGRNKNAANQKNASPPKPLLVYRPSPSLQKLIPLSAAFNTTSPISKPTVPSMKVSVSTVAPAQKSAPILPAKRKSSSGSGNSAKNLGLIMECEDDELSPIQWATYKRAENEYLDVLRKLTRWKSRSDVEIVQIDANDSIPAPPRFLTVTEASRLPLPIPSPAKHPNLLPEERLATVTRLVGNTSVSITPGSGNGLSLNQSRVVLTPRSNLIRSNGDTRQQASAGNQAPVLPPEQRLVHLYGKPRRTASKNFAASLFSNGRNLDEICNYLNVTRMVVEVYLIDSVFLQDNVDYMRLCVLLGVTKPMIDQINRIVRQQADITLPKLQAQTKYTFNQIRMCIALLHRGLKWDASRASAAK